MVIEGYMLLSACRVKGGCMVIEKHMVLSALHAERLD